MVALSIKTTAMTEKKKEQSFDSTGFLLWKAGNAWQRQIKIALAPAGITHVQFLLLETLAQLEAGKHPSSQAQIAKAAGIDVMMTSKVLRLLVKKQFVSRKSPRHDARAFSASLTPQGKKVLDKAKALLAKSEVNFFAAISKKKKFAANLELLASL